MVVINCAIVNEHNCLCVCRINLKLIDYRIIHKNHDDYDDNDKDDDKEIDQ